LPGLRVRALAEDTQGRIWIGTDEGGLARFSAAGSNGVPAAGIGAVNTLLPLEDGTVWLGTSAGGLVRVSGGGLTG